VTFCPDMAYPHPLARVAHLNSRPDLVTHPHPLARIARIALCCAARGFRTDSARAAHWCHPHPSVTCDFPSGRGSSSSTRPCRSHDFLSGPCGSSSSTRLHRSHRSMLCGSQFQDGFCPSCSLAPPPPEHVPPARTYASRHGRPPSTCRVHRRGPCH
jgi:hypothetical protein